MEHSRLHRRSCRSPPAGKGWRLGKKAGRKRGVREEKTTCRSPPKQFNRRREEPSQVRIPQAGTNCFAGIRLQSRREPGKLSSGTEMVPVQRESKRFRLVAQ